MFMEKPTTYSYGVTLHLVLSEKPVFTLSPPYQPNSAAEAFALSELLREELMGKAFCNPTIKCFHSDGSTHEALITPIVLVTPDGLMLEKLPNSINFWNLIVRCISKKEFDAMSTQEKIDLLNQTKSIAFKGVSEVYYSDLINK